MTVAGDWHRFELLRWDGPPPSCVRCGVAGRCSLLPGEADVRRVWRCAACRSQFSVLSGTLLERTRVPLAVWPALIADAGTVPARELARRHGVTPETARLVVNRLAAAGLAGAADALLRLLRLDTADVDRIRRAVPARRASHYGPTGSYG